MKKSTKNFLENLEKKTSISFDWSESVPTEKYVQSNGKPAELDTILVKDDKMIFLVYTCGCVNCNSVFGIDIFYGLSKVGFDGALSFKNQIIKIEPKTTVDIFNEFDLESIAS